MSCHPSSSVVFACAGLLAACGAAALMPQEPQPAAGPRPGQPDFSAYRQSLPGSEVGFDMVPVPGGRFRMGSPPDEPGRSDDEGPQVDVEVEPFWMGRCEVTWAEFELWNTDASLPQSKRPDGLSRPTPPYVDMTFQMGRDGCPAICMSHAAAREYCRWLSARTGRFHRLPTEAEWEYACRAGSTSAWSFGDEAQRLDAFAWFEGNSERVLERGAEPVPAYHRVGEKAPNAWGLCDLHGNVAEWVADGYFADAYAATHGEGPRRSPYLPPARDAAGRPARFPHVVRGGSWGDPAAALRSAARRSSLPEWNQRDPQIPKSWWYLTEGQHVGFRVVRPWREPPPAERARFEEP
ncbi:MAG: formylglycine-generating enzyme family protein [Planctomycetes bacterium]|nr:formylglycine-generating enzyme family protein [Planctomycetota bacterium]